MTDVFHGWKPIHPWLQGNGKIQFDDELSSNYWICGAVWGDMWTQNSGIKGKYGQSQALLVQYWFYQSTVTGVKLQ